MKRLPAVTELSPAEVWAEVEKNVRLCHHLAPQFHGLGLDHDDLVQEGCFGLKRAVELFNPGVGVKFSTYAKHWICEAMGQACADKGRPIRIPKHHGKGEDCLAAIEMLRKVRSLYDEAASGDCFAATLPARPELAAEREDLFRAMRAALLRLGPRDRQFIEDRFLSGGRPARLQDLGDAFGMCREQARYVQGSILAKLKRMIEPD